MVDMVQEAALPDSVKEPTLVEITIRQFLFVALTGMIVGILTWGLANLIGTYVFHPLMCREASMSTCGSVSQYSEILGTIIASGAGLFGLVRLQVFRPLLVALASAISLWGLIGYTVVLFPWYGVLLSAALLYTVSYMAFMWISRIRLFGLAIVFLLALVIGIRLLFS